MPIMLSFNFLATTTMSSVRKLPKFLVKYACNLKEYTLNYE